jgi:CBS domain-containing protein
MNVQEIMSPKPVCCAPNTPIRQVAEMMVSEDVGEIPVCDDEGKPVGVVTDRDIACRLVAKGKNPLDARAEECMSTPVITAKPEMPVEEAARMMQEYQVRRLPVVDRKGVLCGIVSQADLARKGPREATIEVVGKVSEPNTFASNVGGR